MVDEKNNDGTWGAEQVAQASAELAAAAVQPVAFGQLGGGAKGEANRNLDLLLDVDIPIAVEVGRAKMSLEDVLKLVPVSVIALDKKAEELRFLDAAKAEDELKDEEVAGPVDQ